MPFRRAVCGVIPNWAKTGIPARGNGGHCFGKIRRAVELDHVRAGLFYQADRGAQCGFGALLQRAKGNIDADQSALDAAADRLADD